MTFFRGNETQITAQLNYGPLIVDDGTVTCISPSGYILNLIFTANQVYSYSYVIGSDDESGLWNLTCSAVVSVEGETEYTSDYVELEIKDRLIIEPIDLGNICLQGQEITIRINATYDNGLPAEDENITLMTPAGNITMSYMGNSMYEASYTVNELGTINISFGVGGISGTTVYTGASLSSIKPFNPLEYVWVAPVVVIVGAGLLLGHKRYSGLMAVRGMENKIEKKELRKTEIGKEKKSLQKEYMQTRIPEEQFRERMNLLDTESQKIDIEIKELKKDLRKGKIKEKKKH
jgi:hypothetical protein